MSDASSNEPDAPTETSSSVRVESPSVCVEVLEDPPRLMGRAAERIVLAAREAIARRGRFSLALSGGQTPSALYRSLSEEPFRSHLDWSKVHVFWGDERCVPPNDADSNFRMARETLLDHVPVDPLSVHRMRGEDPPEAAAVTYERELKQFFSASDDSFDLVLLGIGGDGHTASLFPHTSPVHETARWVTTNVAPSGQHRLTLTPVVFGAARACCFLVIGADKAAVLRDILEGPRDLDRLPAQAIVGQVRWMVDESAASRLHRPE